jgi:hypothetical protein
MHRQAAYRQRTRNITIAVSEEAFHHARLCAAYRHVTVSALLRSFIESLHSFPDSGFDSPGIDTPLPPPLSL